MMFFKAGILTTGCFVAVGLGALTLLGPTKISTAQPPSTAACASCSAPQGSGIPVSAATADVVTVQQGGEFQFVLPSGSGVPAGGEWAATLGEMSPNGFYKAPVDFTVNLFDQITYTSPDGHLISATVKIDRNPALPLRAPLSSDFGGMRLTTPPDGLDLAAVAVSCIEDQSVAEFTNRLLDHPSVTVNSDQSSGSTALGIEDVEDPIATTDTAYAIQAYAGEYPRALVGISQSSPAVQAGYKPKRCKIGPLAPSKVGQQCPPGNYPLKYYQPVKTFRSETGPYKTVVAVSASAKIEIGKIWGASVGGSVTVGNQEVTWWRIKLHDIQNADVYTCVDGKLVFVGVQTCERAGVGISCVPSWGTYLLGYPKDGINWSGWNCYMNP